MSLIAGFRALKRKHYREAIGLLSRIGSGNDNIAEEDFIAAQIGLIAAYEGIGERGSARTLRRELEAEHGTVLEFWSLEMILSLLEGPTPPEPGISSLLRSPPPSDESPSLRDDVTRLLRPLPQLPPLNTSQNITPPQRRRPLAPRAALPAAVGTNAAKEKDAEGGLDFHSLFGALRRHAWVVISMPLAFAAIGGIGASTDSSIYKAQFELLAEPLSLETKVISSTTPEGLSNRQEVVAVAPTEATLKILKSPRVLEPLIEELQQQYPEIDYESLVKRLELTPDNDSFIVRIEYEAGSSQEVQDVLARVADTYLEFSSNERQSSLQRGLSFVEEQIPRLRSRVEEIQESLQNLREEGGFIEPGLEAQRLSSQLGQFTQQRLNVRTQLNETRLLARDLEAELARQSSETISSPALSTPRYEALLDRLQDVDVRIAQESTVFRTTAPQVRVLQEERQRLTGLLRVEAQQVREEVESQVRELEAREQSIDAAIERLNGQNAQLSQTTRQYAELQRKLAIVSKNLDQFLSTREELGIDVAQSQSPWEILTPPEEPYASSASVPQNSVLGAMLGLILGVGIALALDRIKDLLNSPREVGEVANLPLLGVIPFSKALTNLESRQLLELPEEFFESARLELSPEGQAALLVESFRSLHTSIQLINPDMPVRSLVVSSATPHEGKTTVAINLARAAAAMERRVLLVEADLRSCDSQGSSWFPDLLGLMDLMHRQDLGISDVIRRSSRDSNLFILPSGRRSPDPSRILSSERMRRLMQELQAQFELVIYDTTILTGYADAHLLANATDGLVLVTRVGWLKREALESTVERLRISRTPTLGLAINGDRSTASNPHAQAENLFSRFGDGNHSVKLPAQNRISEPRY